MTEQPAATRSLTQSPDVSSSPDPVVLRAENITKVFPGTLALDNVSFNVYSGKVNVLVGENGAGKSTLMKILAGVEQPSSGQIFLEDKEIQLRNISEAAAHGIGIIFQEMSLCPNLSVVENIFLAREVTQRGLMIDQKTQKEHTRELIHRLCMLQSNVVHAETALAKQKRTGVTPS